MITRIKTIAPCLLGLALSNLTQAAPAWTGYDSPLTNTQDRVTRLYPKEDGIVLVLERQVRSMPSGARCPDNNRHYIIYRSAPNYQVMADLLTAIFTSTKNFKIQISYDSASQDCFAPIESFIAIDPS